MDTNNKSNHSRSKHQPRGSKEAAPSGIDLHPQPQKAVRISRRAEHGHRLRDRAPAAGIRLRRIPPNAQTIKLLLATPVCRESVTPATQAALGVHAGDSGRHGADDPASLPMSCRLPRRINDVLACGADPKTGQPYRFNPQTGQPCDGFPQERVVVRQPNADANAAGCAPTQLPRGDARRAPDCSSVPARAGSNPGSHQHPQFRHAIAADSHRTACVERSFSGRSPEPCSGRAAGR